MENKKERRKGTKITTKMLTRISFLALIGLLMELLNFAIPIFPMFLKLDLSNLPSVIAAVMMGPVPAILTELVKNILKAIIQSETVGIGEISNFICGVALAVPIGIIYKKIPNAKGYIIASVVGVISLVTMASISNYLFVIPAYATVAMGGMDSVINMAAVANENIKDLKSIIILAIVPFNLIKGSLTVIVGYVIYKFVLPAINK